MHILKKLIGISCYLKYMISAVMTKIDTLKVCGLNVVMNWLVFSLNSTMNSLPFLALLPVENPLQ